jgi:hypothetical protein
MSDRMALKVAVDLLHVPSRIRVVRTGPLPEGVPMLLRIAAGERESEQEAAVLMDRPPELIREAAMFFIEQILFAPDADSYRVLGRNPQATPDELRRNVALLLRWLHPDLDPRGERSVFVGRVTAAWNNLKTPERRAAYDEEHQRHAQSKSKSRSKSAKSRNGRHAAGKVMNNRGFARMPHSGTDPRRLRGTERISFLRRALAVLLRRPVQ